MMMMIAVTVHNNYWQAVAHIWPNGGVRSLGRCHHFWAAEPLVSIYHVHTSMCQKTKRGQSNLAKTALNALHTLQMQGSVAVAILKII